MKDSNPLLLVEDDDVDAMTVRRALRELKVVNPLQVVHNGEEALEALRQAVQPLPALILLDLNMPRMNGIEFLRSAKLDERLRLIPVVVLTTSREEQDRLQSFSLGAAGYMLKPVDYRHFVEVIRTIHRYWSQSEMAL